MGYNLDDYGSENLLKLFPIPDYSNVSTNVKVSEPEWISFDDIHYEETAGNIARLDNEMESRVDELTQSFSKGIQTNQDLGAVQRAEQGSPKKYNLLYGFGRTIAQKDLGAEGWAFNIITASECDSRLVCSVENEAVAPKKLNKEDDIAFVFHGLIRDNHIENKQTVIEEKLITTYPRRGALSLSRILNKIMEMTNTPVKFKYYTPSIMKDWREQNYVGDFTINGEMDNSKGEFGFTTKPGGLYRNWHRASTKYNETNLKSYVNGFAGYVKKDKDLNSQRIALIQEYVRLRVKSWAIYGKDVVYLILNGFFPQDIEKENIQNFIKVDQIMLDKIVRKCYTFNKKYRGKLPQDIEWKELLQF